MLHIVSTPIGNLEDISLRALRVLGDVPIIICERPSHTLKLLSHFKITGKKLIAYTEANKHRVIPQIIKTLATQDAAFVTDAGTPTISDPGPELIKAARGRGIAIGSVPGPSALTAAIALSGERLNQFIFTGFWPKKLKEQNNLLRLAKENSRWLIAFEAPHRIEKTLASVNKNYPQSQIILVGEISKVNEKVLKGTAVELLLEFRNNQKLKNGEWVIMIST